MAALTVNGAEIEYRDEGEGDPAFVFIHGWACEMSAWTPQVDALSRDHRCIAVNLRGRGASKPIPPFDTTQATDDVAALTRTLGVGPAVVVGHNTADQKPFMVIWGDTPLGDPDWLRDIATFVGQEPMAGAGHFFQLERPEVTNALLRAFPDDVPRDRRIAPSREEPVRTALGRKRPSGYARNR